MRMALLGIGSESNALRDVSAALRADTTNHSKELRAPGVDVTTLIHDIDASIRNCMHEIRNERLLRLRRHHFGCRVLLPPLTGGSALREREGDRSRHRHPGRGRYRPEPAAPPPQKLLVDWAGARKLLGPSKAVLGMFVWTQVCYSKAIATARVSCGDPPRQHPDCTKKR